MITYRPWEWEQDATNSLLVRDARGNKVCEIIAEDELTTIDGENARLIAAAPDLATALEKAIDWLSLYVVNNSDAENDLELARAVLSKVYK